MKIILVNASFIRGDGQGRVNYEIARYAVRAGHEVTLVSGYVDPDLAATCKWERVDVRRIKPQLFRNFAFSVFSYRVVERLRSNADVVMGNGSNTLARTDVNAVHFVHGSWLRSPAHTSRTRRDWYGLYSKLVSHYSAFEERFAFRRAKAIVAVSELVRQQLIGINIAPAKVSVIFNGVDTTEFSPREADRAANGLPVDKRIGLFAGDMTTPRKNLDTILYALCDVPDVHLAVVGSLDRNPYPKLAASLGISDRVHFFGFRKDIADIFPLADFFVFPSRYEACSLVLLEALAAGLPVITARSAGGSEIVDDASGFVLEYSDDRAGLAEAIRRLATDDALRERQRTGARALAMRHSWQTMAQCYVELFDSFVPKFARSSNVGKSAE